MYKWSNFQDEKQELRERSVLKKKTDNPDYDVEEVARDLRAQLEKEIEMRQAALRQLIFINISFKNSKIKAKFFKNKYEVKHELPLSYFTRLMLVHSLQYCAFKQRSD